MKSSWIFIIYMLWLNGHQCAPTKQEEMNLRENLKQLSEVGEKYVDEEVKKALIGIKQMKIMMERNEDKHIDLMKTLKKSSEEKQQALRLMDEVKARLEEEERQCQVALKNLWDECESCLESTCMRYYTTCKRGVSTFKRKIPLTDTQMYLLDFQEVMDAEIIAVKVIYHFVTVFDPLGNFLSELCALFEAFKFAEGRKDLPIGESGQAFYKSWQEQSPSVPYTAHKYTEMHLASFQDKVQIVCWKKSECRHFEPPHIKGQLVEDFLRKIPPLIFTFHEDQGKDIQFNEKSEKEDTQLVKMEDLFSQLLSDVGSIFDRSFIFFKHMQKEFDQSFQTYFMSDLDLNESPSMAALPEDTTRNDSSQKGWAMPGFLQIVFDFSRTVFEGVSEVITDVFDEYRDYRRDLPEQTKDPDRSGMFSKIVPGHQRPQCRQLRENSSGCPQFHERCQKCQDNLLHDCPNVPELHIKFDEAFKLVNLSGEQYEQILQVVRHHTEDTSYLLTKMKERFGWVSELSNMTIGPESIFNIVKVVPGDPSSKNETVVDVNILTSPTFTIKVPPNLDPESAEFIEYVAGKALQLYKQNF